MLVVFLILFTKVLADNKQNKYVDLLPEAEKQQFLENIARRILRDVESKEGGKNVKSGELADEQLQKHDEFVKTILKEETDNIRRSKGDAIDKDETSGKTSNEKSDEKANVGAKLLNTGDSKRGIGDTESSADEIKVKIIRDNAPILKRSVQNDTSNSDTESDDITSDTSGKVQSKTKESNKEESIVAEKSENEDIEVLITSTEGPKLVEPTTKGSEPTDSISESSVEAEPIAETTDHGKSKTNESKNKDTELTTTTESKNKEIQEKEPKSSDSSETDVESIRVKGIKKLRSRKSNDSSKESEQKITETNPTTQGKENVGVKSTENESEENNSLASGESQEITTLTNPVDSTTTESISTTQNIDEVTELLTSTESTTQNTEKNNVTTEYYTKSIVTSTTAIVDEGTTDLISPTTLMESTTDATITDPTTTDSTTTDASTTDPTTTDTTTTDPTTTEYETTAPSTTESTLKAVATTEKMQTIVEDFTSAPTIQTYVDSATLTTPKQKKKDISKNRKLRYHAVKTTEPNTEKPKLIIHKLGKIITGPKKIRDEATAQELKEKRKTKKDKRKDEIQNKNFIELQKVYYDNNYRVKTGKDYRIYEIPADKSPFIPDEQFMREDNPEQPYYVPVYNYSPNNAYFNPTNRRGPNADDVSREETKVEAVNAADDEANNVNEQPISNENFEANNVNDMAYSQGYGNKRKKFGNQQKQTHSILKTPQQINSQEKKPRKLNSANYLDSDYYFGRVRKDFERRINQSYDLLLNSNEGERPRDLNLKDHIRAVRNILFQQKHFGRVNPETEGNIKEQQSESRYREIEKVKQLNANNDNSLIRNGNGNTKNKAKHDSNNNNIAIDYYFGRSKAAKPSAIITLDVKEDEKTSDYFKKVGYLKDENNTKELYVMDDFFKNNVINYIRELKTKDNTYVKSDLVPATPLPNLKQNFQPIDEAINNVIISKFRDEEKKRNADITKNYEKNHSAGAFVRLSYEKNNDDTAKKAIKNVTNTILDKIDNVKQDKVTTKVKETLNSEIEEVNFGVNRRSDVEISVYLQVLKDMISLDNKGLKQYDWLGTTVDIQSSLQKLFELIGLVFTEEDIHPADMEILKYVLFQHKLATEIAQAKDFTVQLRKKLMLPRNKKKKEKHNMLKEKGLLHRAWLYLRREVPQAGDNGALKNLNRFLMATEDGLFDLHEAIKNIAKITKYKNQHWYKNLKELYLNTDDQHVLQLLLHMTLTRLFGLIEESSKNGLEDDYVKYMKKNKKEAKRTLEEMLFVIQIVDEINKL